MKGVSLDVLVAWLPVKLQDKAKTVVASIGAAITVALLVWPGEVPSWLTVASSVVTVLGVYGVPNLGYTERPARPVNPR